MRTKASVFTHGGSSTPSGIMGSSSGCIAETSGVLGPISQALTIWRFVFVMISSGEQGVPFPKVVMQRLIKYAYHPNGEAIFSAKLSYSDKLKIVSKTILFDGYPLLPEDIVCSLRRLNKIRNRLSHNLDATITKDEAVSLFVGDIPYAVQLRPIEDESVEYLIYQYTPFLFGNMLPKYEEIE